MARVSNLHLSKALDYVVVVTGFRSSPFWDKTAMTSAVQDAASCKEALARLGYTGNIGHYYPSLKRACERFGLRYPTVGRAKPKTQTLSRSKLADLNRVREAADGAASMKQVLERLEMTLAEKNYDALQRICVDNGIQLPVRRRFAAPRKVVKQPNYFERSIFIDAVLTSTSKRQVLHKLGVVRDVEWLRRAAEFHQVALPVHAPSKEGFPGARPTRRPLEEILVENSTANNQVVKRRILAAGLLEPKCSECGQGEIWEGKPLTLQLDHINGAPKDNRLDNLRLLCPNCHSQTATYGGRTRVPLAGFEPAQIGPAP